MLKRCCVFAFALASCGAVNKPATSQLQTLSLAEGNASNLMCKSVGHDSGYVVQLHMSGNTFDTATLYQRKVYGLASVAVLNRLIGETPRGGIDGNRIEFVFGQASSGGYRIELTAGNLAGIRSARVLQRVINGTKEIALVQCTN